MPFGPSGFVAPHRCSALAPTRSRRGTGDKRANRYSHVQPSPLVLSRNGNKGTRPPALANLQSTVRRRDSPSPGPFPPVRGRQYRVRHASLDEPRPRVREPIRSTPCCASRREPENLLLDCRQGPVAPYGRFSEAQLRLPFRAGHCQSSVGTSYSAPDFSRSRLLH